MAEDSGKPEPVLRLDKVLKSAVPLSFIKGDAEFKQILGIKCLGFDNKTLERACKEPSGLSEPGEYLCWEGEVPSRGSHSLALGLIETRIESANLVNPLYQFEIYRANELVWTDPQMALAKVRTILEGIMTRLHERAIGNPGTKRLDQLIRDLSTKGVLPRKILANCEVVRELGNVGSHPILDGEIVTHKEAQLALLALLIVIEWYNRVPTGDRAMMGGS